MACADEVYSQHKHYLKKVYLMRNSAIYNISLMGLNKEQKLFKYLSTKDSRKNLLNSNKKIIIIIES